MDGAAHNRSTERILSSPYNGDGLFYTHSSKGQYDTADYGHSDTLQGYYDARTGTQLSHIDRDLGDTTDGQTTLGGRSELYPPDKRQPNYYPTDLVLDDDMFGYESQFYGQEVEGGWFTPHTDPYNQSIHDPTSPLSPIQIHNMDEEILLRPSLPRHSSMKPAYQAEIPAFDPSLSTVRETSVDLPYETDEDGRTYGYPVWGDSYYGSHARQLRPGSYDQRPFYTRSPPPSLPRYTAPRPTALIIPSRKEDQRSSISSSIAEMRSHYNREQLLGTVEKVRNVSSRSKRRPDSYASGSSYPSQCSPQHNPHSPRGPQHNPHSPRGPQPKLQSPRGPLSPLLVSNNNNGHRGLLTMASSFKRPSVAEDASRNSLSNVTSGFNSANWSNLSQRTQRQTPLTPYEYDISGSPSVELPRFHNRFYQDKISYAYHTPAIETRYNSQHYVKPAANDRYKHQYIQRTPSDSVDENYEFDPVLIEVEPQDFFHIQDIQMPESVESESQASIKRPPLYAEKSQHVSTPDRFARLRQEYKTYLDKQNQELAVHPHHLESEIL